MELIVTATLIVIIVALTVVHVSIHNSRSGRLIDKISGPRSLPIIGNVLDLAIPNEALWTLLRKYADDYYAIYKVWLGPWPVVNLRHPDDVEVLLTSQKNISKSYFYEFLQPWLKEGLLTSTGDKCRGRRKTLTPAFHFNVLQEFVEALVENSEQMVNTLKEEGGEVVKDTVPFFAKFSLNAICETAMGTTLDDNDPEKDKYRSSVKQMGEILYHRAPRPWLKNNWIFSLTQKGREQVEALKILHRFTTKIIDMRKQYHKKTGGKYLKGFSSGNSKAPEASVSSYNMPLKKRLAMLDLLIAVQKEHGAIDDIGIHEEVDTFIFEGHDTTNMGMCFAVLLLAEHQEKQARERAKIDSILKDSDGKLGMNELHSLPYLDRCIKESLRMFPSVPAISRHITSDMHLKKCLIPRGTIVNLHIFDVHRDPNFWPQPHVYDPDRFLPDRIECRHPFSYIPFSGGPRNCIGQKYAMMELKTFIGLLLNNFYLEPMIQLANIRMLPDLVLKSVNPLNVKFVPIR